MGPTAVGPKIITMKRIQSTVTYTVPNWNYCNSDNLINGGELSKHTCRFCVKTKAGHECLLYNESLSVNDGFISKVRACCKATAGYQSNIVTDAAPQGPTIPPKQLMKSTIDLYAKTVNDLLAQGYPRNLAEQVAKQYLLDNN